MPYASPQPRRINPPVCPLPRSLATTGGISVDFSSSPYLDVSVQAVPHLRLFCSTQADRVLLCRVSPFGNSGIIAYVQLPRTYRSLSRPSSALDAKAFPLRSFQLDLVGVDFVSLASPSPEKLAHFITPPLQIESASLGFDLVPRSALPLFAPFPRFLKSLGSLRIMQASDSVHCSFVLPFFKKSTNYFVTSLLLARNFLLASLFSFQGASL